ncbi:MAG: hypothetical protein HY907_12620 [Deltaproteobacteria bacterium]|nr:hypothetical protein [Deltaproteobacteria bacterium]
MVVVTRVAILTALAASAAVATSAKADDVDAEDDAPAEASRDHSGDVDWSGPAYCAPACADWGCGATRCDACELIPPGEGGFGCECIGCQCSTERPVCAEICRLEASGYAIMSHVCDWGTSCDCDALNGCSCAITSRSGFLGLLFAATAAAVLLVRRRRGSRSCRPAPSPR